MKSFNKYALGIDLDDAPQIRYHHVESAYNAGAEEMKKSLRCETCRHVMKTVSCDYKHVYCGKLSERVAIDFGCINHEQKEEKRNLPDNIDEEIEDHDKLLWGAE